MKPPTSNQPVRSKRPVSRRDLLGTLIGTAGFALLPSSANAQKPTRYHRPHPVPPPRVGDANGVLRWSYPANPGIPGDPALHFNGVAYSIGNSHGGGFSFFAVDCGDGSGNIINSSSHTLGEIIGIPAVNTVFSLMNDQITMQGFSGLISWQGALDVSAASNFVVVDGDTLVYVDQYNYLRGLQFTSSNSWNTSFFTSPLGPAGSFSNPVLQALNSDSFLILQPDLVNGHSTAYYVSRSSLIGSAFAVPFATSPFVIAPPYFYCLIDDGSYWSVTQNSISNDPNFKPWDYPTGVVSDLAQVGNLVSYNNFVYFAASDGNLYSVDMNTGAPGPTIPAAGAYASKLWIQNGAAYCCSPNDGTVYGLDLASGGESKVTYTFSDLPVNLIGLENGVSVVNTLTQICGVDLASELRGYSCDSVLMAEDYVASGSGYQPANPGYRTTLQLLDQNNNPRAGINVRIQASDTVTIVSVGTTYSLNPGDAAWLTTDASGNLDFVSFATDIQSPALYVWAAFMDQNEAIVIYPDHQALTKLANSQAGDYQNAQGFDGNPILPSNVPPGYVAQTVQNILGASLATPPQLATSRGPLRATANSYSQYPATTTNLIYQAQKGATARTFNQGSATSFTATIDDDGSFSFQSGVAETPGFNAALSLSFSDFKRDIVQTGKKIKSFAVAVASDVTHTITAIDDTIYQFTITCLEDAVTALTGLFKTIFSDLTKVVEFLSTLYDWGAIKANHQAILIRVSNLQISLRSYLTSDSDALKTRLHDMFLQWENNVNALSTADGQIGGSSVRASQQNGNDPKQVFGSGGGYAQAKAFHSKIRDNARSASTPLIPTTLPLTPQAAFNIVQNLIQTQIPDAIAPIAADLKTAILGFISGFKQIFTDPMNFVTQSFHNLLLLLTDLIQLLIQALDYVIEFVITLLADLVDTMFSLLTGSFQIPVLSDLFQLIFGRSLSLLDLAAWAVAVPLTIVQKVSSVSARGQLGNGTQDLFAALSTIVGSAIDAVNDDLNYDPSYPLEWIDLAAGLLTAGLAFPPDADFKNDAQIVYYALGFVPLILSGADAINATILNTLPRTEAQQAQVDAFNVAAYRGSALAGAVLTCFTVEAWALGNSAFNANTLKTNLISNLALLTKNYDFSFRQLTVASDFICPTTAALLTLANS